MVRWDSKESAGRFPVIFQKKIESHRLHISKNMKNTEAAFHWIIDILERRGIIYKISGGLAARAYGSKRELADIDIEVADTDIVKIIDDVKPFIIFGPGRYQDENWDLELMTLEYEDQEIDIAGAGAKIFNQETKQWESLASDLENTMMEKIFDRIVPIETKESLLAYKARLKREVDLEDIKQLAWSISKIFLK